MAQRYEGDPLAPAANAPASLTLYIEPGCRACAHALEVLARVEHEFAGLEVSTVELGGVSSREIPNGVFAAPTFVLDGEVISLGTPTWERLAPLLRSALGATDERRSTEG
jgi:hypothetical protein